MKTRFQNLFYLEKALNKLNIVHKKLETKSNSELFNINLVLANMLEMPLLRLE
jgi:hypothetical protein